MSLYFTAVLTVIMLVCMSCLVVGLATLRPVGVGGAVKVLT